jgi:oligopeptidase A
MVPSALRLSNLQQHLQHGGNARLFGASADNNPLFLHQEMPKFRQIQAAHVEPAITQMISDQLAAIDALEAHLETLGASVTYDDIFTPLEKLGAPLSFAWCVRP